MKFIVTIFLLIVCCSIQLPPATAFYSDTDAYRCEHFKIKTLEIKDNPFVKPGKRDNKSVWYQSVTWTKIPPGQIIVTVDITVHDRGTPKKVPGPEPFDLFLVNAKETDGSFANLMRFALGIPRFSNPVMGERTLDPQMFSAKPCTVFYLNVFPYFPEHQYTYEFTVTAKEGGKAYKILSGSLIKPDE